MSDSHQSFSFIPISKLTKTAKHDLRTETPHQDKLKGLPDIRETLLAKDQLIKSQRNTIRLYAHKLESLEQNNSMLKQIIGVLTTYITKDLNETLPPLPALPQDFSKLSPIKSPQRLKGKSNSVDLSSILNTISQSTKHNPTSISSRNFIFDPALQNNLFQDFHEAEFIKAIVDCQLGRSEMQKVVKFLLGQTSQDVFLFKTRTILFESISFFLSLRNVAFLNSPEIFLPRALEMMMDILEVEKVTVLVYENDSLFSIAVTAESPVAVNVDKGFGHFAFVEEFLVMNSAYDDYRFDKKYDHMCGFVTRNLACVAISIDQQKIGILECCNKSGEFSAEDIALMGHISRQLGLGQVGLDVREKIASSRQNDVNRSGIESCRQALLMPALLSLTNAITELVGCERISVFLYASDTKELVSVLAAGVEGVIRLPMNLGIVGLAFMSNVTISADASHKDFYAEIDKKTGFVTKEILAVPIKNIGVVQCLNKKNQAKFSKTDEKRAEVIVKAVKSLIESVNSLGAVLSTADINEICVQTVSDGVIHVNHQGVVQKINQAAAEMLETKCEKVIGANINEALEMHKQLLIQFWECVKNKETKMQCGLTLKGVPMYVKFIYISGIEENASYLIFISLINTIHC